MERLDVKNNIPALADYIVDPGIVAHDDAMVFRITAGRDHRAAITRRVRSRHTAQLLIKPGHVVIRQFLERVERHDVPAVDFDASVV